MIIDLIYLGKLPNIVDCLWNIYGLWENLWNFIWWVNYNDLTTTETQADDGECKGNRPRLWPCLDSG